jgi:hypothetical protein
MIPKCHDSKLCMSEQPLNNTNVYLFHKVCNKNGDALNSHEISHIFICTETL